MCRETKIRIINNNRGVGQVRLETRYWPGIHMIFTNLFVTNAFPCSVHWPRLHVKPYGNRLMFRYNPWAHLTSNVEPFVYNTPRSSQVLAGGGVEQKQNDDAHPSTDWKITNRSNSWKMNYEGAKVVAIFETWRTVFTISEPKKIWIYSSRT